MYASFIDDATQHTSFECEGWHAQRHYLVLEIGVRLILPVMVWGGGAHLELGGMFQ